MRPFGSISLAVPVPARGSRAKDEASHGTANAGSCMDEGTFRALYEQIAPRLQAYIRRACGDAALSDDLLQETFYRFLRAHLPPMDPWQCKAYLYRTASSLLTDHWRRCARDNRWRLERFFGQAEAAEEWNNESQAMLLFRRLKPREQTLLWLAYVEGFDHREIALALQLGENSVRVLLFRARRKFGDALRKEGFGVIYGSSRL
jgi:RNA polymerase sigma-70 factor, ECF subfamily